MADVIQIQTTTASREEAQKIADALVEQRLAACVKILGPIHSTYRWQGKVEHDKEWLCLINTEGFLFNKAEDLIKELHSYDVPEIVATTFERKSREYREWIGDETQ